MCFKCGMIDGLTIEECGCERREFSDRLNSLVRGDFILDTHIHDVFNELRKRAREGEPFERFEFIDIWLSHAERLILEPPNARIEQQKTKEI